MTLTEAEQLIATSPDHRLLRRVPPVEQWVLPDPVGEVRRGLLVDCETTGLDLDADEVIELAVVPFDYDSAGHVVAVHRDDVLSSYRQPSISILEESILVHGITDADVAGHRVDEVALTSLVESAGLVIAHNAAFDRPMLEKHWPAFEKKPWACSLKEIDWKLQGINSSKLDYLLFAQGYFHNGHRALDDALATLFLLTLELPVAEVPALEVLLESARKPLWKVTAWGASYDRKDLLKRRGYQWDGENKVWSIMTSDHEAESAWLCAEVYGYERKVDAVKVPAMLRYSRRL
jgi:DNA polymerase-3 subunit epsilon